MSISPFDLLLEMERNAKVFSLPMPAQQSLGHIWQGMGFYCAKQTFVVPLTEIKEVISLESITPLPTSATWFLGVMNHRGQILPITDLQDFILHKTLAKNSLSKIFVLDFEKTQVGFLVEHVLGVQRFQKDNVKLINDSIHQSTNIGSSIQKLDQNFTPYLQGVVTENNNHWFVISLKKLSETPLFNHIIKEVGG